MPGGRRGASCCMMLMSGLPAAKMTPEAPASMLLLMVLLRAECGTRMHVDSWGRRPLEAPDMLTLTGPSKNAVPAQQSECIPAKWSHARGRGWSTWSARSMGAADIAPDGHGATRHPPVDRGSTRPLLRWRRNQCSSWRCDAVTLPGDPGRRTTFQYSASSPAAGAALWSSRLATSAGRSSRLPAGAGAWVVCPLGRTTTAADAADAPAEAAAAAADGAASSATLEAAAASRLASSERSPKAAVAASSSFRTAPTRQALSAAAMRCSCARSAFRLRHGQAPHQGAQQPSRVQQGATARGAGVACRDVSELTSATPISQRPGA